MEDYYKLSKIVSHALRHDPESYGLKLTVDGWISIKTLADVLSEREKELKDINEADIYKMVETSQKKRHEIRDGCIKAIYGHSIKVKIGYTLAKPPQVLYHGTSKRDVLSILQHGLKPMGRLYVHLFSDEKAAYLVGERKKGVTIVLRIKAIEAFDDNIRFYLAEDNVWLADLVPPKYIEITSDGT